MMKTRIKSVLSLSVLCLSLSTLVKCDSNSSSPPPTETFSARQAKDYSVGGGGGGTSGIGMQQLYSSYGVPSAASSVVAPSSQYGVSNSYGMGGAGSYPPAHYAIAPIVMGSASGMGWYGDDTSGGGGGEDYKELLGLLGLKGIKGIKGLKGLKLLKGLGLLPFLPILAPLLLLAPLLFLLPLLLPLLLLLLVVPIPIITIPPTTGRRRRDINSHNQNGHKTLMQETLEDIATRIPQSVMSMNPKDVHNCMDKFICDTGVFVSHHAPGFIGPAAWLLSSIWPAELQPKVETFKRVANLPRAKQFNVCNTNYKCRIKKLEHLFHGLVTEYSGKLRKKISNKLQQNRDPISPTSVLSALMS